MLQHEREQMGFANLMFLKNYGIKEVLDAVENIVMYLNELRIEKKGRRYPLVQTQRLIGQQGSKSLFTVQLKSLNEKMFLRSDFMDLTAECKRGEQLPDRWSAKFKDTKATLGLEYLEYAYNVEHFVGTDKKYEERSSSQSVAQLNDFILGKFINEIFYKVHISERTGGHDYFKLDDYGNKVGFPEGASKIFEESLAQKLGMETERFKELKRLKRNGKLIVGENTPDISALGLMKIDRRVAVKKLEFEGSEQEKDMAM